MEAVQAQVLSHYRSELVDRIRAKGDVLSVDGLLTVKLAKEFGFCYGVERAIDLAYAARRVFPDQPLYILGEIIHNPEVNDQLRAMDIKFLSGKEQDADIDDLREGDVVLIPAFGTEVGTRAKLEAKGCLFVDTTCGDVMSVSIPGMRPLKMIVLGSIPSAKACRVISPTTVFCPRIKARDIAG